MVVGWTWRLLDRVTSDEGHGRSQRLSRGRNQRLGYVDGRASSVQTGYADSAKTSMRAGERSALQYTHSNATAHDQLCHRKSEAKERTCTSDVRVVKHDINNLTLMLRRAGLGHGFDESSGEE